MNDDHMPMAAKLQAATDLLPPGVRVTQLVRDNTGAETLELSLAVAPSMLHFAGHFPGFPVLPGVVQLDWAILLGRWAFGLEAWDFKSVEQLKFLSLVLPPADSESESAPADLQLSLRLSWLPARSALSFEMRQADRVCASGRVNWGAPT